ncbi:NepR family anti-sigma factor [Salinarimonas ramus]|uniref:Anti-sigma factor NepR domain-containing protein n=1 Tax=Salinarimonas ramus TaxID=690164 RepID=A0A917V8H9_9HYPH|nr:NepR family anti-sigma factor [Salinarimonas ramus]GGK50324.1 hypothetical protein GCM10011322_41630 [Salinarimonas ramus]
MKVNKGTGVYELGARAGHEDAPARDTADPRLDRATQARIGDQLRAMYSELLDQPVPDRFVELLAKMDDESRERSR